jgi:hypothetical protein
MSTTSSRREPGRQIRKSEQYRLATRSIALLTSRHDSEPFDEAAVDNLLYQILPILREASESVYVVMFDGHGGIIFSDSDLAIPERLKLLLERQEDRQLIDSIAKEEIPLVLDKNTPEHYGDPSSLRERFAESGLNTLLAQYFGGPWGTRYVVFCNAPSYFSVDTRNLVALLRIVISLTSGATGVDPATPDSLLLELGELLGQDEAERSRLVKHYKEARLSGEWRDLENTSRQLAKYIFEMKSQNPEFNIDTIPDVDLDQLLADFLDAKLSSMITTPLHNQTQKAGKKVTTGKTGPGKKQSGIENKLLQLIELIPHREDKKTCKYEKFQLELDVKGSVGMRLPSELEKNPLTASAIARVAMWGGFMQCRRGNESDLGNSGRLSGMTSDELFRLPDRLPEKILSSCRGSVSLLTSPYDDMDDNDRRSFEDQIDCLRTQWQRIFYLAWEDRPGDPAKHRTAIEEIYRVVVRLTASVLRHHLVNYTSPEGNLITDSDWLIIWLTSNVLLSRRLNDHYGLNFDDLPVATDPRLVGPTVMLLYMYQLSQMILYALHCIRHNIRKKLFKKADYAAEFQRPRFADLPLTISSRSHAQLFILSEYAYREIRIPREICIFERLVQQMGYELPLYAVHSFYRDHLFHVMDVCLLGELLLRSIYPVKGDMDTWADKIAPYRGPEAHGQVLRNWYIAALCHDLGYVIEQAEKFLEPAKQIDGEGLAGFADKMFTGINDGKKDISEAINLAARSRSDLLKDIKEADPADHGIAGWLHVRWILEQIKVSLDDYEPALTAILRHNLSKQTVDVQREPITLLLMLCDHLQEWGRPRIGPDPLAQALVEALRFSEKPDFKRLVRVHQLEISGLVGTILTRPSVLQRNCDSCVENPESRCEGGCLLVHPVLQPTSRTSNDYLLAFNLSHEDAVEADFEPAISWLMFCRNLQGLQMKHVPLPFDISITMKHTPPSIWAELGWTYTEMDLIEVYANTQRNAAYLSNWVMSARCGEKGIQYKADGEIEKF